MTQASFEYNGATITVQNTTGRVEVLKAHLRSISGAWDETTAPLRATELITGTLYLSHTVKVEGSLGFDVPIADATPERVRAFVDGLLDCDVALVNAWDDAITQAGQGANEPDLLPSEELTPAKKKTPTQKPSVKPSVTGS